MFLLLPVIVVGMALETLSVGMVVPVLGILMNETYFDRFPELIPILDFLGNPSHEKLIFIGLSGLASAFVLKNLFLFYQVHCQGTFVYGAQREIGVQLFQTYLKKGYLFHARTNSATLLRNLTTEINSYCGFFLMPTINLLTETLVILAILSLVFWLEPKGTLFLIFILGVLVYLFVKTTNRFVGSWGKKRIVAEEEKIKHLQQGFGGIKEIILSGKLNYFIKRFHQPNHISGLMNKREYIFQYVPKQGVEIIAICGLVGMCLFLISQGKPKDEVTHMLGLMATAGFRMIPSFSRILNNLQSIRYGWASVDALSDEFNVTLENGEGLSATSIRTNIGKLDVIKNEISLSKISFAYAGDTKEVLSSLSLNIKKGETIGLSGESGSGKSTLTNVFLGLLQPSSGEIHIDDHLLNENNVSDWQQMVGYVPQDIYLLDDTLRRNIAFGVEDSQVDDDRVLSVLKMAQLEGLVAQSKSGIDLVLGERGARLSGGQKQRIGIARALYNDPQFIILDEATSALDNKTEKEILKTLKPLQGDKTFLIIAHRQTSLDLCDKVYELRDGVLIN
ncbi:ABC transporter ATP-binding protein/permease [Opitutales bacterium]|nr:ABC transporter ATP-binding protein/permease [Opitutales bacterium]